MKDITTSWGLTYQWGLISINEGEDLIKEKAGKKLSEYIIFDCEGVPVLTPYLLEDGSVVVIVNSIKAQIYSNLKGYMVTYAGTFQTKKYIPTTYPIHRIEYFPKGDKVYYFQLSPAEGEVIRSIYPKLDKAIYPYAARHSEIYKTPEQEIMEYKPGYEEYRLFQCDADFKRLDKKWEIRSYISQPRPRGSKPDFGYTDINMVGRNPYGQNFPDYIDQLAESLPDILKVSEKDKTFTYHRNDLPKIDRLLNRHLITDDFIDKAFLPFLSYLGKIYTKEKNVKWIMKYDKTFDSWSPDLEYENNPLKIYAPLLKILNSTSSTWYSLTSVLESGFPFTKPQRFSKRET